MNLQSRACALCARAFVFLCLIAALVFGFAQQAGAQTFTVVNKCSYTVYPGIYPAVYQNGGWSMAPGASVSFAPGNTFNGRIWGRIACNSSSPAQCATGSCGGTGLQCAGTTGQAGTSLAEFNLNAAGTDWYDVSYVDGIDNPIGIQLSNSSCVSPNVCNSAVISNCPAGLKSGDYCLSPCSVSNTDQFCCRNAFGTNATCIVSQWPAADASYVTNIHTYCPNEYAYAYDDAVGLHTCPTGSNYTITFCPGGTPGPTPVPTTTPVATPTPTPTPSGNTSGPVSINAGGTASGSFLADTDFTGGNIASTTAAITTSLVSAPVPPQSVFQTERWGAMTYTMGGFTPGITVNATLYFAEIYWTAAGQRQFNVLINGKQVLTNFDIFTATGGENRGIQENFVTTANGSGQVVIQFTVGAADQPKISGITLSLGGSSPTPTPKPTATPTPKGTPTATPKPTATPTPSGTTCATPWAPNTAYSVGQIVSYSGENYKCLQAHTSLTGWEPPNVPALWSPTGACH